MQDIMDIKQSIGESKNSINLLSKVFMIYGTITLLKFIINIFGSIALGINFVAIRSSFIFDAVFIVIFLGFFIFYLIEYQKERSKSNRYYIGFINIFGVIVFGFPIITLVLNLISSTIISKDIYLLISFIEKGVNIMLLCYSIILFG